MVERIDSKSDAVRALNEQLEVAQDKGHPVLGRLSEDMKGADEKKKEVPSYSRMHHRHSRS